MKAFLKGVALALLLGTGPAMALDMREAEAVISVMEILTDEMGEAMTTDAARIFYDYDAYGASLIPGAGFDRAGWIAAYDAVAAGYLALMPEPEFDAVFAEPLARLEASALPEDQKAAMREHVEGLKAEAQAVRASGAGYVGVLGPFENRLRALFLME